MGWGCEVMTGIFRIFRREEGGDGGDDCVLYIVCGVWSCIWSWEL